MEQRQGKTLRLGVYRSLWKHMDRGTDREVSVTLDNRTAASRTGGEERSLRQIHVPHTDVSPGLRCRRRRVPCRTEEVPFSRDLFFRLQVCFFRNEKFHFYLSRKKVTNNQNGSETPGESTMCTSDSVSRRINTREQGLRIVTRH